MAAKTVLNYLDRDSVVHKMTGTTKLAFFLLFTFASMITYNTWVLLGLFAVSLAAFKLSKIKYREVRFMMIFMLVFLLLNNLYKYKLYVHLHVLDQQLLRLKQVILLHNQLMFHLHLKIQFYSYTFSLN